MKKKLLLTLLVVMTLVCLFTIAVSAEDKIVPLQSSAYGELTTFETAIGNTNIEQYKNDGTVARTVLFDSTNNCYYTVPTTYVLTESYKNESGKKGEMFLLSFGEIGTKLGTTFDKNSIIRLEFPADIAFVCNGNENLSGCTNLEEVKINDGLRFWDNAQRKIFTNCKKLKSADLSGMIFEYTYTTFALFEYCPELESVILPNAYFNGESYIDYDTSHMFSGCNKLKSIGNIENFFQGDVTLDYKTFYNCWVLPYAHINDGVTTISGRAFGNCKAITSVVIPESVTVIGTTETVFESCSALKKVVLPSQVSLGKYCFEKCTGLTDIWMPTKASTFENQVFGQIGSSREINFYFSTATNVVTYSGTDNNNDPYVTAIRAENDARIKLSTPLSTKCTVFLGGHKAAAEGAYQFLGDSYVTEYAFVTPCSHGCGTTTNEKACDALITNKGYSVNTIDGVGITYTIVFNPTAIKEYEKLAKTTFEYGLIAATTNVVSDGVLFDATGTAVDENAIVTGFAGTDYTIYNLKITSIPEESQETGIYACAYIIDTNSAGVKTINYVGDAVTTVAEAVTYQAISQKESTK